MPRPTTLKALGSNAGLETCTTNALLHAARRNALSYHVPDCPRCGEGRYGMQLTYWMTTPAEWRCRKCGFAFAHEPVVSNAPGKPTAANEQNEGENA